MGKLRPGSETAMRLLDSDEALEWEAAFQRWGKKSSFGLYVHTSRSNDRSVGKQILVFLYYSARPM